MAQKIHPKASEILNREKTMLRALSFSVIRSIVKQHGGTIEKDLVTDIITINTPEGAGVVCAQEIEKHMDAMCRCVCAHTLALFKGKIPVRTSEN